MMQLSFDLALPIVKKRAVELKERKPRSYIKNGRVVQLSFKDVPKPPKSEVGEVDWKPNARSRVDYFKALGAFLDWHNIWHAFHWFLARPCPSGKKERTVLFEGKKIKARNYKYREFENANIYGCFLSYSHHLVGFTVGDQRTMSIGKWADGKYRLLGFVTDPERVLIECYRYENQGIYALENL